MQKLFYLSKNGASMGPFALTDILEKLKSLEISWTDYLFDDDRQDWMMILEYPALTEKFNSGWGRPHVNPISVKDNSDVSLENKLKDKAWYILRDGNNYGPYSYLEMIQMLQGKTLFEFDFSWRHGMPAWMRIAEIQDFWPDTIRGLKESGDVVASEIFFRRRHVRARYGCSLILHDSKSVYKGRSVEIGVGGAGIVLQTQFLNPGQSVFLHFQPGDGVPPFNAICNIVSKQFVKQAPSVAQMASVKYGVQFTCVSQNIKESIKEFTEKKMGSGRKVA